MNNHKVQPASATAASLALLAAFAAASASAQIVWDGSDNNDWLTGANWVGDLAPSATDIVRFDSAPANLSPALSADTTVRRVEFVSGAGAYTISGSRLILDRAGQSGAAIENNSGVEQTFSNAITLSSTTNNRSITAGLGSTLTFANTITMARPSGTADTNLAVNGAGTINLQGLSGFNQFQQDGSVTVNIHTAIPSSGSVNGIFAFNNGGSINLYANSARNANLGASSAGSGRVFLRTGGISLLGAVYRGGNGAVSTIGADISGGGTVSVGTLSIENSTRTNAVHTLSAAADNVLNVTGVVSGASGVGTKWQVSGPGVVRFSGAGANTSTTPIEVSSGRLELNKTSGVNAVGGASVSVLSGAEVRLLAANQIADTVGLTLTGGTFGANGFSETLGTLDLNAASFLDLGDAGTNSVSFANSSALDWDTFSLSISGTFVSGASIRFGTDATGLGSGQLANISITGFTGVGIDGGGWLTASAIPEPSAFAALAGLGALGFVASRRRRA